MLFDTQLQKQSAITDSLNHQGSQALNELLHNIRKRSSWQGQSLPEGSDKGDLDDICPFLTN